MCGRFPVLQTEQDSTSSIQTDRTEATVQAVSEQHGTRLTTGRGDDSCMSADEMHGNPSGLCRGVDVERGV